MSQVMREAESMETEDWIVHKNTDTILMLLDKINGFWLSYWVHFVKHRRITRISLLFLP